MEINPAGLAVLIIGVLFLSMAIINPQNFVVYKLMVGKATPCVGEGNERKWIACYSTAMIVMGSLVTFGVFKNLKGED